MDMWFGMLIETPLFSGQPVTLVGESRRRHAFVAEEDVAAFAVAAIDHPAARNATIAIGGPDALTLRDAVRAYETAGAPARPIRSVRQAIQSRACRNQSGRSPQASRPSTHRCRWNRRRAPTRWRSRPQRPLHARECRRFETRRVDGHARGIERVAKTASARPPSRMGDWGTHDSGASAGPARDRRFLGGSRRKDPGSRAGGRIKFSRRWLRRPDFRAKFQFLAQNSSTLMVIILRARSRHDDCFPQQLEARGPDRTIARRVRPPASRVASRPEGPDSAPVRVLPCRIPGDFRDAAVGTPLTRFTRGRLSGRHPCWRAGGRDCRRAPRPRPAAREHPEA